MRNRLIFTNEKYSIYKIYLKNMKTADEQIRISNKAICRHIENFNVDERGVVSQDILKNLRDLVEAVSVKACGESEYSYDIFQNKAKQHISSRDSLRFLSKFHKSLQKTVSHYLPDEENSERLMLKYYEYLLRIKSFLKRSYHVDILENIKKFPISIDPVLTEYYKKISVKINQLKLKRKAGNYKDRFYIRKIKPFFIDEEVYYEVTFTTAIDNASKFDRIIAFTKLNISDNYAVKLTISNDVIDVFGKEMPIQIIDHWEVSIRPCEMNYFADIFGDHSKISSSLKEYRELMILLTKTGLNLVEVIEFSDEYYQRFKNTVIKDAQANHFFNILDNSRELIKSCSNGTDIVKYLLYKLNNKVIKLQLSGEACSYLSNLNLKWGCIPFDQMPFVTSPIGHNPKIYDLFDCLGVENREHELFARFIKNNTENKGCLYTPIKELEKFDNTDNLIRLYNNHIYKKHKPYRNLENYKNHIYINGYEQDTFKVIQKLKKLSSSGIKNYSNSVSSWLESTSDKIDCDNKKEILKDLFKDSHVGLIYGAAGTGKTRLIEHISSFFHEHTRLYLANTNPAVNNLKSRITTGNSTFKTITSFLSKYNEDIECDLLIIDECSTVSNADMLKLLEKASFKLLILVGDVFQIESINFGNWFSIAKSFIPKSSVSELTKPYRSTDSELLNLWNKVRDINDDILEHITNNNYSKRLDESIFEYSEDDEIILCLNYDGLYGINNINKFLQGNNTNSPVEWGVHIYKIGDPILFNESNKFKPLVHNNLKGRILNIEVFEDKIQFDIEINKSINEFDTYGYDLELLGESDNGKSVISFSVNRLASTDEDEDEKNSSSVVPFQVAYAVSIHKAQGLEYNSVKVIITDEAEELVTHNMFYTAITRAKEKLRIYWTPDTENKVLEELKKKINNKDV